MERTWLRTRAGRVGNWGMMGLSVIVLLTLIGPYPVASPQSAMDRQQVGTVPIGLGGSPTAYTIPIYQVGTLRYISTGVGIEERRATYPSFPLKVIFADRSGAYVTAVAVAILDREGQTILEFAQEDIVGPWLLVDLPRGSYTVKGTRAHVPPVTKQVQLHASTPQTIYLSFASQGPSTEK